MAFHSTTTVRFHDDDVTYFFGLPSTQRYLEENITYKVMNKVSHEVDRKLQQFQSNLSGHVRTALDNSREMNQILDDHKTRLSGVLETRAREITRRICEDPSNHEFFQGLHNSIKETFDRKMQNYEIDFNNHLSTQKDRITTCMQEVNAKTNELSSLKHEIMTLKSNNQALTVGLIGLTTVTLIGGILLNNRL